MPRKKILCGKANVLSVECRGQTLQGSSTHCWTQRPGTIWPTLHGPKHRLNQSHQRQRLQGDSFITLCTLFRQSLCRLLPCSRPRSLARRHSLCAKSRRICRANAEDAKKRRTNKGCPGVVLCTGGRGGCHKLFSEADWPSCPTGCRGRFEEIFKRSP